MKKKLTVLLVLISFTGLATAQGQSANLEMEVLDTEPAPLQAGEYADVWIRVTNTGSTAAPNPTFEVVDNYPFTPVNPGQYGPNGELGVGESYTRPVKLKVNENAVFGENDLKIRKSSDGGDITVVQRLPLEVRTDDRSLVISSLEFPERVEPGSSAEMTLTLENLADSTFRNIDVSLDFEQLPVAPRETSRKRVSSVGAEDSEQVTFTLDVDEDADNQLHTLPVTIDYQNQAGTELSTTETTGVNIGGYPNIDVGVESSDIRTAGRGEVTFRILNRGEGQARFAELNVENSDRYQVLSESSVYLGSMIADDYQTATFDIYVEEGEGNLEIPVTVEYRDGEGDQLSEFNVERTLYSGDELSKYNTESRGSLGALIGIAALVLVGGVYYWRRRK